MQWMSAVALHCRTQLLMVLYTVKLLLQHGADVNRSEGPRTTPPLITACANELIDMAVLLLTEGADVSAVD
jgi:ankyrin repeat protein